ncbi:cytochrome c oxidase subunit II [Candidatus Laterigemmans baculatus]|uniref:cytochrome c oxidase subunit II n=1 Tax=Candidatus Laterigemmans baculatus TaxID=2770505 RepID=UPI0013DBAADA|nr:cytochrome c oxidase subunit II [Candidatus Laterigemmans baculatus]
MALLLSGCQGDRVQSSLHPAGPAAEAVAQLWWVLLTILGLYTLAVFVLTALAIFRRNPLGRRARYQGRAFILVGGVILPAVILVPLLIYSLTTTVALHQPDTGLTIRVVGHRWWWEIEYPGQGIVTANEIYIPVGEPVQLELTSADVIHSFWVPQLHGKRDLLPGQTSAFWIEAERAGVFRGQCAEFCGLQHAHMALTVEALPPEEFAAWIAGQQRPGDAPADSELADSELADSEVADSELADSELADSELGDSEVADRYASPRVAAGRSAFFRHGCAACHAIAGTRAVGQAGPDLTYIGSRPTLGAATIPNTRKNLLAWVANPQAIKPGVNMPPTHAPAEEIEAIVSYLQSLQYEREEE